MEDPDGSVTNELFQLNPSIHVSMRNGVRPSHSSCIITYTTHAICDLPRVHVILILK